MTKKLKFGLVGLGNIGKTHMDILSSLDQVEIVGVCDRIKQRADQYAERYRTTAYDHHDEMFAKAGLDAVIIAVPHYDHPTVSLAAFEKGIHVLLEKPIAVHVKDARLTIEGYERAKQRFPKLLFGLMFQERTLPYYLKIKEIVDSGQLGQLVRTTWINTEWFRSQAYYDSGGWRATWAGEGGGILTNQCPHNLDFYQWVFGMPKRIRGHASIGKYHDIEVEDEVTAYFEHENGMVGHFIVTTAESPGTNRLEIVGENGRLVYEHNKLTFYRNYESMLKFSRESKDGFANVDFSFSDISIDENLPAGHRIVTEVFVNKLLYDRGELIAEGSEGIHSVAIANGIMLSAFTGRTVELPYDEDEYFHILHEKIRNSKYVKDPEKSVVMDVSVSFTK